MEVSIVYLSLVPADHLTKENKGENGHVGDAIEPVDGASMTGQSRREVFDADCSLEARGEEADEGGEERRIEGKDYRVEDSGDYLDTRVAHESDGESVLLFHVDG